MSDSMRGPGIAGVVLLAALVVAQAQQIRFTTQPKEKVISRLMLVETGTHRRAEVIERLFMDAGCASGFARQDVKQAKSSNLICTLPGETDSVILLGAHFDGIYSGQAVADNWSGALLLPTVYEDIKTQPRKHTFVFAAFTGEEAGLLGSEHYAKTLTKEDRSRLRAVVNVDTLGLSNTKVWVKRADPELTRVISMVAAALKLPIAAMNADGAGDSDSHPFVDRRIPVIDIHSITPDTLALIHSKRDTLAVMDTDAYYNSYRLISAYLVALDQKLD